MFGKLVRLMTCMLPVAASRRGRCTNCGACCRLPRPCPFLRRSATGQARCAIYLIRPPSCRRYPRSPAEFVTAATCGYFFADGRKHTTESRVEVHQDAAG